METIKKKLLIEIEIDKRIKIIEEDNQYEENEERLKIIQDEYYDNLTKSLVQHIENYIDNGNLQEEFIDQMEELTLGDFEDFKDYGIRVNIKEVKDGIISN